MKYQAERAEIARLEAAVDRKIKKIANGTYNPLGKRSVLHTVNQTIAHINATGERPQAYYAGVNIAGTKNDPRRNSGRYTKRQLDAYKERLEGFLTPTVGFYELRTHTKKKTVTSQYVRSTIRTERAVKQYRDEMDSKVSFLPAQKGMNLTQADLSRLANYKVKDYETPYKVVSPSSQWDLGGEGDYFWRRAREVGTTTKPPMRLMRSYRKMRANMPVEVQSVLDAFTPAQLTALLTSGVLFDKLNEQWNVSDPSYAEHDYGHVLESKIADLEDMKRQLDEAGVR